MKGALTLATGVLLASSLVCLQKAGENIGGAQRFSPSEFGRADTVLEHALRAASASRKRVLVVFGASWCGACSEFTGGLSKGPIGRILLKYFVVVKLAVHERGDYKKQENERGSELLRSWSRGVETGLPYYAVIDEQMKVLADSIVTKYGVSSNQIGFTGERGDHLINVIRKTARALVKADDAELVQFVNGG